MKLPEDAAVLSCYEAGPEGFWLHRYLTSLGIANVVLDSSSIEVNRRHRRAKTDKLDVASLLRLLIRYHSGDQAAWRTVRIPTEEEEDRRHLHRELKTLKDERNRTTNRMKGLLATQGVRLKGRELTAARLDSIRLWDGSPLLEGLKSRLKRACEQAEVLKRQIRLLHAEQDRGVRASHRGGAESADLKKVRQLMLLKGIGVRSAYILVRELFGWRTFQNRSQVGGLIGFNPTPYNSGTIRREQGISKAGNRHVRAVMVELAWCWVRYQENSRQTQWYLKRFASGGPGARKKGIVAVGRRLLIDLWRYLEMGVLPEGAELKGAVI